MGKAAALVTRVRAGCGTLRRPHIGHILYDPTDKIGDGQFVLRSANRNAEWAGTPKRKRVIPLDLLLDLKADI